MHAGLPFWQLSPNFYLSESNNEIRSNYGSFNM